MQFELSLPGQHLPSASSPEPFVFGSLNVPVLFRQQPRAQRYILRLHPDGTARVTIPQGGSPAAAREFLARQSSWLRSQLERLKAHPPRAVTWHVGSEVLFRGTRVRIELVQNGEPATIQLGTEHLRVFELRQFQRRGQDPDTGTSIPVKVGTQTPLTPLIGGGNPA